MLFTRPDTAREQDMGIKGRNAENGITKLSHAAPRLLDDVPFINSNHSYSSSKKKTMNN